jgi:hypothetical protein
MTHVGPAPITAGAAAPATVGSSFVEWGAVIAGAFLAAAISFVLLTFGAAIGLSAVSPWPNSGASAKVIASVAVFWAMAQQIGAFMAGGYVAGRMRSRWHESGHEADFRDGLHGALVWAVGVVIGAALFLSTTGSVAKTGTEVAGGAAALAGTSTSDPMDAVLDSLTRPATVAQAGPAAPAPSAATPPPGTPGTQRARAVAPGDETRAEMSRIMASAVVNGSLSGEQRAYLVQLAAQRAGIPQQEAERRVDQAFNAAREAADKARRAGILTGFVTAASLVLSLGAAWWAAVRGGNHRDNSIPARFVFGDRRRTVTTPNT